MTRTIAGVKYLMRDTRPLKELLALHRAFCEKYGPIDIHEWLVTRGKVYKKIKPDHPTTTHGTIV